MTSGPTPIARFPMEHYDLLAKLEFLQAGESIKARIGEALIDSLALSPETRWVVEATAGNTALALANALTSRGSDARVVAVMSSKMSAVREQILRDNGIDVERVDYRVDAVSCAEESFLLREAQRVALTREQSVLAGQFTSPANPRAHEVGTGSELVAQLEEPPDALVIGAGTGGTLTGVARAVKSAGWHTKIVLADPEGSVIAPAWHGRTAVPGKSRIEGIGSEFVPPLLDLDLVDAAISVPDYDAFSTWRACYQRGMSIGSSTACAIAAADCYSRGERRHLRLLVFWADHGLRYPDPWAERASAIA